MTSNARTSAPCLIPTLALAMALAAPRPASAGDSSILVLAPPGATWVAPLSAQLEGQGAKLVAIPLAGGGLSGADWESAASALEQSVGASRPALVIVVLGEGDGRDLLTDNGGPIPWGTPEWSAGYLERVAAVLSAAGGAPGVVVTPLTHPHPNTNLRGAAVSLALRRAALDRGWGFADAFSFTSDLYGRYTVRFRGSAEAAGGPPDRAASTGRLAPQGADRFATWLMRGWILKK